MKVLVTGAAGFIGYHCILKLMERGHDVVGLDNLSDYYDVSLKRARLSDLKDRFGFSCDIGDIAEESWLRQAVAAARADVVLHLAAQAGVRYSLSHPQSYVTSNLVGFANVLEACRATPPRHLLYASSSSVYGGNDALPFRESDPTEKPLSLYAATKKANEAMAYSYSRLYAIPATGLRFFTVYGEWGRPDMAFFSFAGKILAGLPLPVFNQGRMVRDFTYAGDVAEAVLRLFELPPPEPARHRIVNIGSGRKVPLLDFIAALEAALGRKARLDFLPHQPGDMTETWADTTVLRELTGFSPGTSVGEGVTRFGRWYEAYRAISPHPAWEDEDRFRA